MWTCNKFHIVVPALDALHMDKLMSEVDSWRTDPALFLRQRGRNIKCSSNKTEKFVLIVEGFLIFNYRYMTGKVKTYNVTDNKHWR